MKAALRLLLLTCALALLTCALALLARAEASACSGVPGIFHFHPASDYWDAQVVFVGTVTGISQRRVEFGEGERKDFYTESVAHFEVDEAFRGAEGRAVDVVSGDGASCQYVFSAGERYFVYAGRMKAGETLRASLFSRTRPLAEAADDLAYARDMTRGETGARIFGLVQRYRREGPRDYGRFVPVEGVAVSIEGSNGQRWETTTDARGQFEVRGGLRGSFRVRASLADGLRFKQYPKEIYIGRHPGRSPDEHFAGVVITATSLGSVAGRVVGDGGEPAARLMLDLLALDAEGKKLDSSVFPTTIVTDDKGEYTFADVPPGRYLLAVNPKNHVGRAAPAYTRNYYPGTTDAARAAVVNVEESVDVRNEDFRLSPPLKARAFEGVVVTPEGSPAAGAQVQLVDPDDGGPGVVVSTKADEQGRFRLEGFEGLTYLVEAVLNIDDAQGHRLAFAPAVRAPSKGGLRGMRLVLSSPVQVRPAAGAAP